MKSDRRSAVQQERLREPRGNNPASGASPPAPGRAEQTAAQRRHSPSGVAGNPLSVGRNQEVGRSSPSTHLAPFAFA